MGGDHDNDDGLRLMTITMITMMVTAKATKYDSQLMNRNRNWLILIQVSGFWGRHDELCILDYVSSNF